MCKHILSKSQAKNRKQKAKKIKNKILLSIKLCLCKRVKFCKSWVQKHIISKKKQGFGMIELLIVATIIATFSAVGAVTFQASQQRSRDAQRKTDLEDIAQAYEEYYNDTDCYPSDSTYTNACGQPFRSYLKAMPCDPQTNEPYLYQPLDDACRGYRLFAAIENNSDPIIEDLGCNEEIGCGYGPEYKYGVAVGTTVFNAQGPGSVAVTPPSSPSPTQSPGPGVTPPPQWEYACDISGTCNQYEYNSELLRTNGCITFETSNCANQCYIQAVRCSI